MDFTNFHCVVNKVIMKNLVSNKSVLLKITNVKITKGPRDTKIISSIKGPTNTSK